MNMRSPTFVLASDFAFRIWVISLVIFEVPLVVVLKVKVSWNEMLHHWTSSALVLKDCAAF
jgi:hypothetical protein